MEFNAQEMMKGEGVMHEKMPRMYSLRETAKRSGLSIYFLRQLIAEEKVRYLQCGKKYLINYDYVIAACNGGQEPKAS